MNKQITKGTSLTVLYLEDSIQDFEIISEQLIIAGYDLIISRVDTENEFTKSVLNAKFDIILADFSLPGFDAFGALQIQQLQCPETPFICISGSIGEEQAVELLKQGATDYVIKDRLSRLGFAVHRALETAEKQRECKIAEEAVKQKAKELQMFYELTVGRELKMVELKTEINELLKNAGKDIKYLI